MDHPTSSTRHHWESSILMLTLQVLLISSVLLCCAYHFLIKAGHLKSVTRARPSCSTGEARNQAHPSIKWAAFYSDCEHRVLEVTEGHRLTLTYNLYVVQGNGFLGRNSPVLDPVTLPLYRQIRDLVQDNLRRTAN